MVDGIEIGQHGHPRVELKALAESLSDPRIVEMLESSFTGSPIAHLLVCEAWMREYDSLEERRAETRMLADIPGSIECRWAFAVIGAHMIAINRVRGKDPSFTGRSSLGQQEAPDRSNQRIRSLVVRAWGERGPTPPSGRLSPQWQ